MISLHESAQRLGLVLLLATTWSIPALGLDIEYCATLNTGETPRNTSIYQTNGLCHDFCMADYAFAITQKNFCWCSNYAPAKAVQKDLSDCTEPCPAYPDEQCGGPGLFGYIVLDGFLPSGTQGASTSTEAEPTTAIQKVTETVQNTVTVTPKKSSATSTSKKTTSTEESSTETETETEATTTKKATTSSAAEEKPTLIQTVTADGTVKTVTIGPTRTGTTAHDSSQITVKDKGLSTGQVVGIVVGIIGAVIIAAGLALFFWFRRKKQQRDEQDFQDDPSIRDSSSGMVTGGRPDMSMSGGSPVSAPAAVASRNSTLQVDPRMNPFKQGLYVRSASHESINTLRDDHDYSRRILRATNPDPTPGQ